MAQDFILKPGILTLKDIENLLQSSRKLVLSKESYSIIRESRDVVEEIAAGERTTYGINTGFGVLANKKISKNELADLQKRLVLSHAVGLGKPLDDCTTKLVLLLKINSLAQGYSGVTVDLIDTLLDFYNNGIHPLIPAKGSVGASGDLAPLAHMAVALMGIGDVRVNGKIIPVEDALEDKLLTPVVLKAKEGLALLNGTQVSTAIAIIGLIQVERNFSLATIAGALSLDAVQASIVPFDETIAKIKKGEGQERFSSEIRNLMDGSEIMSSHMNCSKVQDPYCMRCQPQVMGAVLDKIVEAEKHIMQEANGVSDNPIVLRKERKILSGGNFHAESIAINADILSIVCSEIGAISERRIAMMVDNNISGLPHFLVQGAGLNSGFMIAHVTAAALASENKTLSHPASVDSIPTSANQEDHVSMATFAARKMNEVADNVLNILAIETLAACQGLDFRKPLNTSKNLKRYYDFIRSKISFYEEDRFFAADIEASADILDMPAYYQDIKRKFFNT